MGAFKDIENLSGIRRCPVCGEPFKPYHSRQKTCGRDKCKREYRNGYLRQKRREMMKDSPEMYRKYHREAQRRYRHKKKLKQELAETLEELNRAINHADPNDRVSGIDYGKRQAEATLAQIPKIKIEETNNDDI